MSVTLTASGDAATYHWDLGDGTTADGAVVTHVYAAGSYTARVTATAGGESAQAEVSVVSLGLALANPHVGRYQQRLRFHGRLVPGLKGVPVVLYRDGVRLGSGKTRRGGRFTLRGRVGAPDAQYTVRYGDVVSNPVTLAVRPGLDTAFVGSGRVGRPLALNARERPVGAGTLTVRVWRSGRLRRDTHRSRAGCESAWARTARRPTASSCRSLPRRASPPTGGCSRARSSSRRSGSGAPARASTGSRSG